ncbi:MAG: hypothetical protein KGI45_03115 [Patescibacteria group bacterium]|nr:hypothetical protein [Patescibacteria group bacterium]MDE1940757.1 hypothetical protein [Patescibacteria group bacterium]MDE1967036.1 hypothetical protein [Patescibacteria group bacterium]
MSLFSRKDLGELILILDVQSSVVRGSLCILKDGALPQVVFTYNASIPWKPHTDSNYLIKVTLRAIEESIDACLRDLHLKRAGGAEIARTVSAVHYALSSPWIVSQAKTVNAKLSKEVAVTRSQIEKIIAAERAKMTAQADIEIIEEKIFDVRLNGYSIREWAGKAATDIEISYAISVAGTRMIDHFRKACARAVKRDRVRFHSSLLLQFIGMQKAAPEHGDFSLIHVHGELTDIAVISAGEAALFGSYPFGVQTIIREAAERTGTSQQAADSLITLYTGKHIDPVHDKIGIEAIDSAKARWADGLESALSSLAAQPPHFILSAWAHDDFFREIIAEKHPGTVVESLSIDVISPHVAFWPKSEKRRHTGLYAIAIDSML